MLVLERPKLQYLVVEDVSATNLDQIDYLCRCLDLQHWQQTLLFARMLHSDGYEPCAEVGGRRSSIRCVNQTMDDDATHFSNAK